MSRAACVAIGMVAWANAALAQAGKPCLLTLEHTTDTTRAGRTTVGTRELLWFGGGVKARCAGTAMELLADSAESLGGGQQVTLIGHTRYTENGTVIDAQRMQYFSADEHVIATGDVHARTRSRSTLTSDQMFYFRAMPAIRRPTSALATGGRPHAELRDSAGSRDTTSTLIDADQIMMQSDTLFYASGRVIITRPDLMARCDSAETNTSRRFARFIGGPPHVEGRGDKHFSLDGRVLDVFARQREIERLYAKGHAVAVSDSLQLTADTLDIRMASGRIDSVAAWGGGRARATSSDRDIVADRIHLSMSGGQPRRIYAVGRAHADTKPDTLVRTTERDWIEGDTLIATFEPLPKGDTTTKAVMRALVARGAARSYYHLVARETTDTLPALDYVVGKRIDVAFSKGDVASVHVTGGDVHGMHLEPQRAAARKDTANAAGRRPPPRSAP